MYEKRLILVAIKAMVDTLREVQEAPAGIIYAALSGEGVSMHEYATIEAFIMHEFKVTKVAHLLTWTPESEELFQKFQAKCKGESR